MCHLSASTILLLLAVLGPAGAAAAQTRPAAAPTLTVVVTDPEGNPLDDVAVAVAGRATREGTTTDDGRVQFRTMRAGEYRLRFEREGYITLERDVTMRAGQPLQVDVTLSAAPAPPAAAEAAPADATSPPVPQEQDTDTPAAAEAFEPVVIDIPGYVDRNLIRREPMKESLLGCVQAGAVRVLQVREPVRNRVNLGADEFLYLVAGEAAVDLDGRVRDVRFGTLTIVPRATPHTIARRGRNPAIVLVIQAGQGCAPDEAPQVAAGPLE